MNGYVVCMLVVSRLAFISHCQQVDPSGLGKVAEFAAYCFKIRVCDDPEVKYNTVLQVHFPCGYYSFTVFCVLDISAFCGAYVSTLVKRHARHECGD